jgi:cytidylate kinase
LFFDTGVMYRAITWLALQRDIPLEDEKKVTRLAENTQIDVRPASKNDGRTNDVLVDGQDVTWEIREPLVDAQVSIVAAYPGVRHALTLQQRRVGLRGRIVMVGRDIGTVVLPDADLKIYLDASPEQRAHRRTDELSARGQAADFEEILDSMRKRDHIDSSRKVAPLQAAPDAVRLISDHLNADQVLQIAVRWAEQGLGQLPLFSGAIDLITILADDVPAMVRFYEQVLGFTPLSDTGGYVEFKHQGVRFAICNRTILADITQHPSCQAEPAGQSFELAFLVKNPSAVDETYLELLARGASPVSAPQDMPWGQRTAFFADPEGYIHEIFANPPA